MEYRGFVPMLAEFMIRLHAQGHVYGWLVGARALADTGPGTPEEKISRAMEALYAGEFHLPAAEPPRVAPVLPTGAAPPGDQARRKPGRPPKAHYPDTHGDQQNGRTPHDPH